MEKVSSLRVKDVMEKNPPKVSPKTPLPRLLKIFRDRGVDVIPVFDGGSLVGEIYKIDLLKLVVNPRDIPRERILLGRYRVDFGYFARCAGDIMRENGLVVDPDMNVGEAAYKMLKRNVRSAVVVKGGRIVGILRVDDIIKAIMKRGKEKWKTMR